MVGQADLLYRAAGANKDRESKKALIIVLGVLNTLVKTFPELTINTLAIPRVLLDKERNQMASFFYQFEAELATRGVDKELIAIVSLPMLDFQASRYSNPVCYQEYSYLKLFVRELQGLDLDAKKYEDVGHILTDKLIGINYNHPLLLDYCTLSVKNYQHKYSDQKDQEQVLVLTKKTLKQIAVREGASYDPKHIPIIEALYIWLDDEIICQLEAPAKALAMVLKEVKALKKLMMSVPVLAYFTRLCINHGFYPKQSEAEVLLHLVDTYCRAT